MNILIIHEIDWDKKVIFEPQHFAELFSLRNHNVYVIDCQQPSFPKILRGLRTDIIENYKRIYPDSSITLIHPPALLVKGLNRLTHYLTCKKVIKKIVKEKKIDIILLYGVATDGIQTIKIAREFNIPVIHRMLDISHGLVKTPILSQIVKKHEKFVYKNSDKVLATTPDLVRYAIKMGANKDKTAPFFLGINFQIFKPMKKDVELAKTLGIKENDKVIVFIGTIYDFTGLDGIITKFEYIKEKIPNVKLLIVGGGPSFRIIQSHVKKKKLESFIILTNFVPQQKMPNYISLADLCINPFKVIPLTDRIIPGKIYEYLACGKPVLSTPLKGTVELLPNEEFGVIYTESETFVEKLSDIIEDSDNLEKLGDKGYQYVKNHNDIEVLIDKLLEEFDSCIKME